MATNETNVSPVASNASRMRRRQRYPSEDPSTEASSSLSSSPQLAPRIRRSRHRCTTGRSCLLLRRCPRGALLLASLALRCALPPLSPLSSPPSSVCPLFPLPLASAKSVPGTFSTESGYDNEDAYDPMCWEGRGYDAAALAPTSDSTPTPPAEDHSERGYNNGGNAAATGAASTASVGTDHAQRDATSNIAAAPSERPSVGSASAVPAAVSGGNVGTPWDNKLVKHFFLTEDVTLYRNCPPWTHVRGVAPPELTRGERLRAGTWYNYTVRGAFSLVSLDGDTVLSDRGAVIGVQVILCELGRVGLCTPFVHEHANARLEAENRSVSVRTGDRHGETHVHSPTVFVRIEEMIVTPGSGTREFEVDVPVLINQPGHFFGIAAFQLFTANSVDGLDGRDGSLVAERKYDVSNALETRLIWYYDAPYIMTVSSTVLILSGVLVAVGAGVMVFLLQQTVCHITGQVMKLSQGYFLVVFMLAAIVGTVSSFLFNPSSDLHCALDTPLVFLPLTVMYAVVIGRLWRINTVISPLLSMTLENDQKRTFSSGFFFCVDAVARMKLFRHIVCPWKKDGLGGSDNQCRRKTKNIRVKVTSKQLARVVVLFTSPQIIIQALALTLQPDEMVVQLNPDESVGRVACKNDGNPVAIEKWSTYYLIFLLVVMLGVAHESRNLPSLFNETRSIYDSVIITILIAAVGLVVIRLSDSPTTTPDVAYILRVLMVLSMSLNTALRIMAPKIKMVWSGQRVLVSKLVSDHDTTMHSRGGRKSYQSTIKASGIGMEVGDGRMSMLSAGSGPTAAGGGERPTKVLSRWKLFGNSTRKVNGGKDDPATVETVAQTPSEQEEKTSSVELRNDSAVNFGPVDYRVIEEDGTVQPTIRRRLSAPDAISTKKLSVVFEDENGVKKGAGDGGSDDDSFGIEDLEAGASGHNNAPSSSLSVPNFRAEEATAERKNSDSFQRSVSARQFNESSIAFSTDFHESIQLAEEASANRARHLRWRLRNRDPSRRNAPVLTATSTEIRICDYEAPPRRLLLRMIDVSELLERVNRQVMTGLAVSHGDWGRVREACTELGSVFTNDVKFEWEKRGDVDAFNDSNEALPL